MKTCVKPASVFTGLLIVALLSSCEAVKPYQKSYLNEEEMQLSARKVQTFEMNFESYREGASGATGGKMGGGCGCN
ncbi:DUF4266 domain-containing protein [Pontibacter sp. Tf4]|uniref:DUF4266 domain-containing protein n=1 Tax=Pontibacter sp. Tf4 TaxID=2761620 RepID=UPI00162A83B8|nr:DUF4266 domain-containing protein [Pontibacter sp. Tf4]MBB6611558.1 DUF4266 domain-containing protein [Pontibacter sp. Tf4]